MHGAALGEEKTLPQCDTDLMALCTISTGFSAVINELTLGSLTSESGF